MELYEANVPKYEDMLVITRGVYNIPAINIFLWILHCLYNKPDDIDIEDHLVSLSKKQFTNREKEKLKSIKDNGRGELKNFDVLLLSKIIKQTCYEGLPDSITTEMDAKIRKLVDVRNAFAHNEKRLNEYDKDDFERLINEFINDAEVLIYISGKLAKKSMSELDKKFNSIRAKVIESWKSIKQTVLDTDDMEIQNMNVYFKGCKAKENPSFVQEKNDDLMDGIDDNILGMITDEIWKSPETNTFSAKDEMTLLAENIIDVEEINHI